MRILCNNFSKENLLYVWKTVKSLLKKHKFLGKVLLLNTIVYGILLLLYYPKFESDLDIFMQVLLYGVGEEGAVSHNFFNNIIVGKILEILCAFFPTLACYTYFHYILVFISLSAISYIVLKRNDSISGWIIMALALFFMGYEGYILPNYLKTSTFLCVGGLYLLMFYSIRKYKKRRIQIIAGGMLIFSFLISIKAFFLSIILGIIGVVVYCSSKERVLYILRQNVPFLIIITILLSLFTGVNECLYRTEKWEVGNEYASAIEKVYSFGYPDYSEEIQDEIQLTELSYNLITNGGFAGDTESQFATIKDISKIKNILDIENIRLFFKSVIMNYYYQGLFYCWIIIMIIILLFQKEDFKKIFGTSCLLILGMSLILYILNGISYSWMYSLVLFPPIVYSLFNVKKIMMENIKEIVVYIFILCAVINTIYSNNITSSNNKKDMEYAFLAADEEAIKYADFNTYWREFSVFEAYPKNLVKSYEFYIFNGIYLLGGGLENCVKITENPNGKYAWINSNSSVLRNLIRQNGLEALETLEKECSMRN